MFRFFWVVFCVKLLLSGFEVLLLLGFLALCFGRVRVRVCLSGVACLAFGEGRRGGFTFFLCGS